MKINCVKQEQIDNDKEHFKGIMEEKDKCINILKDQYNNISSHFKSFKIILLQCLQ